MMFCWGTQVKGPRMMEYKYDPRQWEKRREHWLGLSCLLFFTYDIMFASHSMVDLH